MKSTCPHCGTTYRIDPRKVPSGGVQARCSRCGGVFRVESAAAATAAVSPSTPRPEAPSPTSATPSVARPQSTPTPPPHSVGARDYQGQVDLPELSAPSRPTAPSPPPAAPVEPERSDAADAAAYRGPPADLSLGAAPTAGPPPAPRPDQTRDRPASSVPRPPPLFGRPDPHGKARRLARALISDIAVYNPERRDRGLAEGTLRQEFREEIRKSWDEYVAQVGESTARSTPYFREALNEILAGGRTVF